MKKKAVLTVICVGVSCFIAFRLLSNKEKIDERKKPAVAGDIRIPVSVATVVEEPLRVGLIKTGLVTPFKEAKVLSVTSGNIAHLRFSLGDNVNKGQVLAVIDTHIQELDLQKKESYAMKLKRDLQTYTELLEGKAATQEKVNEISQNYSDAVNQVQQLRRQIADASIKAPTSGIISTKPVEEGMYVGTGGEITTVVNLSHIKIHADMTESEVYQVSPGQEVKITTDVYPGRSFQGTVSFISPQANQAYNYEVEITADNDNNFPLRSGTFVAADFSRQTSRNVMLIPREALNETTQNASVYVAKDGRAILQHIKVGGEYGSNVYVLEGLRIGDQVVTSGQINLRNGSLINISK